METSTLTTSVPTTSTTDIHQAAAKLGRVRLRTPLKRWLAEETDFVQRAKAATEQFYQDFTEAVSPANKAAVCNPYSQKLLQMLGERYAQPEGPAFDTLFPDYKDSFTEFFQDITLGERRPQSDERFAVQRSDPWKIKLIKYSKKQTRSIYHWPTRLGNKVRRWRKKEENPLREWEYTVPLQGLVRYYYQENIIQALLPLMEETYRLVANNAKSVWEIQTQLYQAIHQQLHSESEEAQPLKEWTTYEAKFAEVEQLLQEHREGLARAISDIFAQQKKLFEQDYERAGTLERPASRFGTARLQRLSDHYRTSFQRKSLGWSATLFALYDDWRLDQELNMVNDTLWLTYFQWSEEQRSGLHERIFSQTDRMSAMIQESLDRVDDCPPEELKPLLRQERKAIDQQLINESIPVISSAIHEQGFGLSITKLREASEAIVDQIADHRGLVANDNYDQPIKPSDISYVSPQQLAEHEMLPQFVAALAAVQQQTRPKVNETQKLVQEIGQISYFSLDSAISVYGQESTTAEEPQQVALEGLKRALTNAERLHQQLQALLKQQEDDLKEAIRTFARQLTELTDNHYALELKFRLARAKATEETKAFRRKTFRYIRLALPRLVRYTTQTYREATHQIGFYQKQIGLEAGAEVTTEISDFLAETDAAINRLPYVYQRLFSVAPLKESIFYQERPEAMAQLQKAFENWKHGRYASTVLVGQKGCGLTTLIRFFLEGIPRAERKDYTVILANADQQIYTEAQFLKYFEEQLSSETPFHNLENIVTYLSESEAKHIFVLEHLEHFYLRKVGGFMCLRWLMEMISRTHQQVFWLTSCTQFSWKYLDKTMQISDHFEYTVELPSASAETVQEIILKRHRVSGYDVRYASDPATSNDKKFTKLSEEEKQAYLKKEYFEDLSRITRGNFAIALLYWLRSAQEVSESEITIGSLKSLDYSFLKSLSVPQIAILHALLLHDGLTAEQFQELAGRKKAEGEDLPASNLQLIQMLDDGLLVKQENAYRIHPLLYQQVVAILQTRNFVH
ncbi:MAG: hypothetical protein AAF992_01495 [Bacteroidota bacterium]|mgnify:CR=1 FL=1